VLSNKNSCQYEGLGREWIFVARATCSLVFKKNQKWYFKVLKNSEKNPEVDNDMI
jgi:hypothetical protein